MKTRKGPKMSCLVLAALRNLRDAHGSSPKEIMKYIMTEYNASEASVQRQLKTALKRGVEYGILKKTNGGYSLYTDAEVPGLVDMEQSDACGKKKKRASCKPKPKRRGCRPKKAKSKCAKRKKRKTCNVCSTDRSQYRLRNLNRDTTPVIDDTPDEQTNKENSQNSRAPSTTRGNQGKPRSRSQSAAQSQYSGSDSDERWLHEE